MCIDSELDKLRIFSSEFFSLDVMSPSLPTPSSSNSPKILKIVKPKLPRKLTKTARINLNNYWNMFESIMSPKEQAIHITEPRNTSHKKHFDDVDMNNEINDNISNEKRENKRNDTTFCNEYLVPRLESFKMNEEQGEVTRL